MIPMHAVELVAGTDNHGIRFTWNPTDPYVQSVGTLEIDVWNSEWTEAASVELNSDSTLMLAQWINDQLGRD